MIALKNREAAEQVEHHTHTPEHIFETDVAHKLRIATIRRYCEHVIEEIDGRISVIELGIGSGDIGGYLSEFGAGVVGYEVSDAQIASCKRRYPLVEVRKENLLDTEPEPSDLLIMCEILEHVPDPAELAQRWMKLAKYAIISSPQNGDIPTDHSGGDHQWSFSELDFYAFASLAGHKPQYSELVPTGLYDCRVILSKGTK